jgi:hypothetical protein
MKFPTMAFLTCDVFVVILSEIISVVRYFVVLICKELRRVYFFILDNCLGIRDTKEIIYFYIKNLCQKRRKIGQTVDLVLLSYIQ